MSAWPFVSVALAVGAATLGAIGIVLQAVTLPGTWIVVLAAAGVKAHDLFAPAPLLSWWTFLAIAALAVVAEVAEAVAGAAGARTGGASRRGMVGAVVGSLVGAVLGTVLLPIVGSLVGAVAGAAAGAVVGELSGGGRTLRGTAAPAAGAVAGRLAGALLKTGFAAAMWVILVVGLVR